MFNVGEKVKYTGYNRPELKGYIGTVVNKGDINPTARLVDWRSPGSSMIFKTAWVGISALEPVENPDSVQEVLNTLEEKSKDLSAKISELIRQQDALRSERVKVTEAIKALRSL